MLCHPSDNQQEEHTKLLPKRLCHPSDNQQEEDTERLSIKPIYPSTNHQQDDTERLPKMLGHLSENRSSNTFISSL